MTSLSLAYSPDETLLLTIRAISFGKVTLNCWVLLIRLSRPSNRIEHYHQPPSLYIRPACVSCHCLDRLTQELRMSTEPESLVLKMLREMRAEMATKQDVADVKEDIADVRSEMHSLRADVASDLLNMQADFQATRRELGDQIVGLRRAVIEYHTSVIGHGILISELEARVR